MRRMNLASWLAGAEGDAVYQSDPVLAPARLSASTARCRVPGVQLKVVVRPPRRYPEPPCPIRLPDHALATDQLHSPTGSFALLEAALENAGALAVTLGDAGDDPQLEPPPGAMPLWEGVRLTALFDDDPVGRDQVTALAAALGRHACRRRSWSTSPIAPGSGSGSTISARPASDGASGSAPEARRPIPPRSGRTPWSSTWTQGSPSAPDTIHHGPVPGMAGRLGPHRQDGARLWLRLRNPGHRRPEAGGRRPAPSTTTPRPWRPPATTRRRTGLPTRSRSMPPRTSSARPPTSWWPTSWRDPWWSLPRAWRNWSPLAGPWRCPACWSSRPRRSQPPTTPTSIWPHRFCGTAGS